MIERFETIGTLYKVVLITYTEDHELKEIREQLSDHELSFSNEEKGIHSYSKSDEIVVISPLKYLSMLDEEIKDPYIGETLVTIIANEFKSDILNEACFATFFSPELTMNVAVIAFNNELSKSPMIIRKITNHVFEIYPDTLLSIGCIAPMEGYRGLSINTKVDDYLHLDLVHILPLISLTADIIGSKLHLREDLLESTFYEYAKRFSGENVKLHFLDRETINQILYPIG